MGIRQINRKSKKSNKGFRKTRSKRQRGIVGGINKTKKPTFQKPKKTVQSVRMRPTPLRPAASPRYKEEKQKHKIEMKRIKSEITSRPKEIPSLFNLAVDSLPPDVNLDPRRGYKSGGKRKSKKSKKEFRKNRKTRSKRQRGGVRDIDGELIDASSRGNPIIVKILLDEGADVNALDGQNNPALFWASFNGHAEVVKNLLNYGADVTIKDNRGHTALYWANVNGHNKVVELLNRPTERQQDKKNLAMVMREKRVERKFGKHRLPPEIGRNIDECLGGKRKSKKSNRKTRKACRK